MSTTSLTKVAAVQAEPVWLDLQGGVDKVISIIQEAAQNGANVLGFPEVFIPGYPWYSCYPATSSSHIYLDANTLVVAGVSGRTRPLTMPSR